MTIETAFTHKTNPDEVLLRDWRRTAPDAYTATAAWPTAHPFYADRLGLHDPLLLSETVRQTLPLLSHGAYGVPFGHHLLWKDFGWELDPAAARADGTPAALQLCSWRPPARPPWPRRTRSRCSSPACTPTS
ncbi:AfsA-related hotdog domain-containing protein [Streptomyces sp. F63]|uniref:AfsA-related hotdog domain-containing protein n=1 Tax=Streptomyces sp. F63 TaxID=2824887 RepID=UPI001FFD0EA6|nr:AfsA-related hotdog domain-containing protein [Streptomyces sp. F63]